MTWDSAAGATYYEVYRAASAGGAKSLLGSAAAPPYDDATAVVGTTYYYWVKACNTWGCSDYSAYDTGYRAGTPPTDGYLSGQALLDGRTVHNGAQVSAEPGGYTAAIVPSGTFTLGPLPVGAYTVDVRIGSYLRAGGRDFEVIAGQTTALPSVVLLGGDCDGDDKINILDASIVSLSFGLAADQPGFDPRADINGDSIVDVYDLVMIGNSFGCSVADPTPRCARWDRP